MKNVEIFQQAGSGIVAEIQANMKAARRDASGRFSRSLRIQATDDRLTVFSAPYAYFIEQGRGITRATSPGTPTLQEIIKQWMRDKGIVPNEGTEEKHYNSVAFLIARKIHNEGTLLRRRGGRSGVITRAINPSRILSISRAFGDKYRAEFMSEMIDQFLYEKPTR